MRWFYYFNRKDQDNLLDNRGSDNNFFICQSCQELKYGDFKNYTEFNKYFKDIEYEKRCFYEIMVSGKSRKPYFDIDIENSDIDDIKLIKNLKNIILKEIRDFGEKDQVLVYSSNFKDKKSYHIIVNGFYLEDEKSCENFYKKITEQVDEKYKPYIDSSIYKSTQQFRILGSHKYNKDNVKIFRKDLSHNYYIPPNYLNELGISNYNLSISLVGNIIGCKLLYGYEEKNEIINYKGYGSSEDLEEVLKIFYKHFSDSDYLYSNIVENDGNLLIILRRNSPGYCDVCKRTHNNENPFLSVTGYDRNIFFYCRRNEKGGLFLGTLGPAEEFFETEKDSFKEKVSFKEKDKLKELETIKIKEKYKGKIKFGNIKLKLYN